VSSVDGATRRRGYLLEILLVSFAALLMEISYTRIVSFKLFYYYTYLIIGLALLGTGCGGVAVVVSRRLRTAETGTIVMWSAIVGAVSVLVGYCIIALTPIDTLAVWEYEAGATAMNVGRLLVICLSLFAAFLPIGVVIALLLSRGSDEIGRLYFADLLGASLACAVVVFMLNWVGPTTAIMVAGAVLAAVGLKLAITASSRWTPVAVGALALLSVAAVFPTLLPEISTDTTKTVAAADIDYSAWSALFRVDAEPLEDQILLHHDGLIGSAIHEYNGDLTTLSRFDSDPRSIPFAALGNSPEEALIIGAAGGNEILASLYFGSRHTDAVELNPVTHGLVTDRYADFAGNIADNEAVNYVWGEGRSFLARSDKEYDLIWFPAPDSYSANAASSAFVLSENYLYTREAIEESLGHLADDGMIAFHYGEFDFEEAPNRTARYTATAREALGSLGSEDPTAHIIVTSAPVLFDGGGMTLSTVLVKESPFTDEEIDRVEEGLPAVDGSIMRYAAGRAVEPNVISEMLETPADEVDEWFDAQATDVSPIDDDAPFFWHFNRFSDVISDFGEPIDRGSPENAVGERVLLLLLGVVIVLASVFLLLPFFAIRETWRALPRKASSASYFACLGVGFIFFEIVLIRRSSSSPESVRTSAARWIPCARGRPRPADRRRDAHLVLPVRPREDHRRDARLAAGVADGDRLRPARAARHVPRDVHAPRHRCRVEADPSLQRVRRLGLGGQRVRLGHRRGAQHDPGDDVRVPRSVVLLARRVLRRSRRALQPLATLRVVTGRRARRTDRGPRRSGRGRSHVAGGQVLSRPQRRCATA